MIEDSIIGTSQQDFIPEDKQVICKTCGGVHDYGKAHICLLLCCGIYIKKDWSYCPKCGVKRV